MFCPPRLSGDGESSWSRPHIVSRRAQAIGKADPRNGDVMLFISTPYRNVQINKHQFPATVFQRGVRTWKENTVSSFKDWELSEGWHLVEYLPVLETNLYETML